MIGWLCCWEHAVADDQWEWTGQHTQHRGHITLGKVLGIAGVIQCCYQRRVYAALKCLMRWMVVVCFKFGQVMRLSKWEEGQTVLGWGGMNQAKQVSAEVHWIMVMSFRSATYVVCQCSFTRQ